MKNKIFWNKFYKKNFKILRPSPFAKFVLKKINKDKKTLLDVGCGNGRDTIYFVRNKVKSFGFDCSKQAINLNIKKLSQKKVFFCKDICRPIKKKNNKLYDYIYARFFLHSIDLNQEKNFFSNCKKILDKKGKIFLEFRTIKDPIFKSGRKISRYEYFTDHYRRFIDVELFENRVKRFGFIIEYKKSGINLAKFKKENPHVCRIILRLKHNIKDLK